MPHWLLRGIMDNNSHSIALVGYASSYAENEFALLLDNQPEHIKVPRKLKRYMAPFTINSLTATTTALADLTLTERAKDVGIYTSQTGYSNPFYAEFSAALPSNTESAEETFKALWLSERVNPFLITNALNNNLLGVSGLNWQLNGDACAFIRDQFGAFGALQEAMTAIAVGECQLAIVAVGGSSKDPLSQWFDGTESDITTANLQGATSLVLASDDWLLNHGKQALARLTLVASGYDLNTEQLTSLMTHYVKPSQFLSFYIDSGKDKNRSLMQGLMSLDMPIQPLNSFTGSDICPSIITSIACNLFALRKQKHGQGISVNCDQAGFYSFVRIENESL